MGPQSWPQNLLGVVWSDFLQRRDHEGTTQHATCLATADEIRGKNLSCWCSPPRCSHWLLWHPGLKSPSKQGQGQWLGQLRLFFWGFELHREVGREQHGRNENIGSGHEKGRAGCITVMVITYSWSPVRRWTDRGRVGSCWNCLWCTFHVQRWDYFCSAHQAESFGFSWTPGRFSPCFSLLFHIEPYRIFSIS